MIHRYDTDGPNKSSILDSTKARIVSLISILTNGRTEEYFELLSCFAPRNIKMLSYTHET